MKCTDCKKRKAMIKFSEEPIYSLTHGVGIHTICRQCYIKRLREAIKDIKINIKKQRELLKKEGYVTWWDYRQEREES